MKELRYQPLHDRGKCHSTLFNELVRSASQFFRHASLVLFAGMAWVGCATGHVSQVGQIPAQISPGQAIAILTSTDARLEGDAARCIGEAVSASHPEMEIVTSDQFRQTIFSYRPPKEAAGRDKYFASLVSHPVLKERMISRGIRYLIAVSDAVTEQSMDNHMFCGGGMGGAGCLGALVWDRKSRMTASVFDITHGQVREISASASGRPWLAVVAIFPLGLPSFTETRACRELGDAVGRFLAGESTPSPSQ